MLSSDTPVLSLGAKGKGACREAEHPVKDESTEAELLARKSQLAISGDDISNLFRALEKPTGRAENSQEKS